MGLVADTGNFKLLEYNMVGTYAIFCLYIYIYMLFHLLWTSKLVGNVLRSAKPKSVGRREPSLERLGSLNYFYF